MQATLILAGVLMLGSIPAVRADTALNVAVCDGDVEVSISPGLSLIPSSPTFVSDGDAGTIDCFGFVAGKQVTGKGTLAAGGVLGLFTGAVCTHGIGGGAFSITVPTEDGPKTVTGDYTFSWAGLVGELTGSTGSGTLKFTPVEGHCLSQPITRASIHVSGLLQES